jgi:hypothetical protein
VGILDFGIVMSEPYQAPIIIILNRSGGSHVATATHISRVNMTAQRFRVTIWLPFFLFNFSLRSLRFLGNFCIT